MLRFIKFKTNDGEFTVAKWSKRNAKNDSHDTDRYNEKVDEFDIIASRHVNGNVNFGATARKNGLVWFVTDGSRMSRLMDAKYVDAKAIGSVLVQQHPGKSILVDEEVYI